MYIEETHSEASTINKGGTVVLASCRLRCFNWLICENCQQGVSALPAVTMVLETANSGTHAALTIVKLKIKSIKHT
jgi:hypothetical protein